MSDWLVFLRTIPAGSGEGPLMAQAALCSADTGAEAVEAVLEARMILPQPGAVIEAVEVADAHIYEVKLNPTVTRQEPIEPEPVDPGWVGGVEPAPEEPPPTPDEEPIEPGPTPAVASFTFDPPAPNRNTAVTFDASASTGAGELSYAWAFEGGQGGASADGPVATHAWDKKGDYDVSLVVTDDAEQTDQQDQVVSIT